MNRIYNFNDYPTKKKTYGGANGITYFLENYHGTVNP